MSGAALAVWMALSAVCGSTGATAEAGISLSGAQVPHAASLLEGLELDSSYKPSLTSPLRITDDLRFRLAGGPMALDQGGGMSSDLRQALALLLGFIPGFGLGHLIAHDRDGFILFLVIDIALYVLWGTVGWVWHPFGYIGGLVWIVVHIVQALDAYAEAGGERIVQVIRERAVEIASNSVGSRDAPVVTTRIFEWSF